MKRGVAYMVASAHLHCATCGTDNPIHAAVCFACGQSFRAASGSLVGNPSSSTATLAPDHLLKERYRIIEQVGKGGFAAVYKAVDTLFGYRLVAVKEMVQSYLNAQEMAGAIEAFKREAHLLAGLQHPNIPAIYDYFGEAGRWYLVMDFIEGETLEEYLAKSRGNYLLVEKVLEIGIQLCTVLGYLHTRQPPIIFRDLKPANIILASSGRVYVIDFGIARHFKPGQSSDTVAFGSPGYAPPEQYGKTQTTPRADIYALGATLHQLLTGDDPSLTPFRFAPLQLGSRTTPAGLDKLIASMLEIDEKRRPASMSVIRYELQNFAARRATKQVDVLQSGISYTYSSPAAPSLPLQSSYVAAGNTGSTTLGSLLIRYFGHSDRVNAVAWSPGSTHLASASDDKTVQIWEAGTGNHLLTYTGHADRVNAVTWSPDGRLIAAASSDATVQVWEADSGVYLFTCQGHSDRVNAVAWSPDSRLIASASDDKTVKIWDAASGHHVFTYRSHSDGVRALAWSPDGQHIASAGDDCKVHVWNVTGRHRMFFTKSFYRDDSERVLTLAWSPDSQLIASAGDGKTIYVRSFASKKPHLVYRGHTDGLHTIAWSPDGRYIASAAGSSIQYYAENTMHIWDAASGDTIYKYRCLSDYVRALSWSPDGNHIATASSDHSVSVWQAR